MSVGDESKSCESRSHESRKSEALHLLFIGVTVADVCEITGLRRPIVKNLFHKQMQYKEPYSPNAAAAVLGTCKFTVLRMVKEGLLKVQLNEHRRYEFPQVKLAAAAEARLKQDGERRARYLLFTGKSVRLAAIRARISQAKAEALLKELIRGGAGPEHPGPFTVTQATMVLGLQASGRQVRGYCEQGRLGTKWANQYQITREELTRFGAVDRKCGPPVAKSA